MGVKIIPAVLEDGVKKTQAAINRLRPLRANLHLDILDGSLFGIEKNLLPEDLRRLNLPPHTTVHLMVRRPGTWLRACIAAHIKQVVLHAEAELDTALLRAARRYFRLVIAVAPGTSIQNLNNIDALAEGFQVMTVRPGAQGRNFLGSQLQLVRQLRKQKPRTLIAVDGGINDVTGPAAVAAGADTLIVGSWLAKSTAPKQAYRRLVAATR